MLFTRTPVAHRPRRSAERRGGGPEVGAINDISGSLVSAREIRSANSSLAAFLATAHDGKITSSKEAGAFSTHYTFLLISIFLFLPRCLARSFALHLLLSFSAASARRARVLYVHVLPRPLFCARDPAYLQITLFSDGRARTRARARASAFSRLHFIKRHDNHARGPRSFFERTAGF